MSRKENIVHFNGNLALTIQRTLSAWNDTFIQKYGPHNIVKLRLVETPIAVLEQELSTGPFLADKRLILLDGRGGAEKKNITKEYTVVRLTQILGHIPDSNVVVFYGLDEEVWADLRSSIHELATQKNLHLSTENDRLLYIQKLLPDLSPSLARMFSLRVGDDILLLENEVQKLSLLQTIREKDITENTIETTITKAFAVTDQLISGNISTAIEKLRLALVSGTWERIFPELMGALRQVVFFSSLTQGGFSHSLTSKTLGLRDFVSEKFSRIPRQRLIKLQSLYLQWVEIDRLRKIGGLPGDPEEGVQHAIEASILSLQAE